MRPRPTVLRRPALVLPGGQRHTGRQILVHALPVHAALAGLGHVGEDGVLADGGHGVGVGLGGGSWSHPEEAVLWVDGSEIAFKHDNRERQRMSKSITIWCDVFEHH